MTISAPMVVDLPVEDELDDPDTPWKVIVWNDPVNTVDYVIYVLQKLFAYDKAKASRLTYQIHNEGKAIVASGPLESSETQVFRLHQYGLWATLEKDS